MNSEFWFLGERRTEMKKVYVRRKKWRR